MECVLRRCKQCRTPIPKLADSNSLQQKGFCGPECAFAFVQGNRSALRQKSLRERERSHNAKKKQNKDNNYAYQKKLTVEAAQKLARRLDRGKPCISCGRPDDGSVQFCGGHYLTKGAHPETALDLRVIHGQCNQHCNLQLSGNIEGTKHSHGYREGIRMRYGDEFVEWLEGAHDLKKWSCEELQAIRKEYNAEIRLLEAGHPPSKDWRLLP